jgi:hypothetical protein
MDNNLDYYKTLVKKLRFLVIISKWRWFFNILINTISKNVFSYTPFLTFFH